MTQNNQNQQPAKKEPKVIIFVTLMAIVAVAIFGSAAGRIVAYALCAVFLGALGYGTYRFFSQDVKYYVGIPLVAALLGFAFGAFEDAGKYGARIGGSFQSIAWLLLCPVIFVVFGIAFRWFQKNQSKIDEKINNGLEELDRGLDKIVDQIKLK
ncbi:MAG: hypothetical protein HYV90_05555 [Candidatus Woesebacteria bacterium]|nr:MAG: hypothetical protein HYV90_05555 [Candidatus Woesebacteria bacterium]